MAVARREERLRQLSDEAGVSYAVCDLATPEGCEAAMAATEERLGPVEILVNNAATGSAGDGNILDIRLDGWQATMRLNLDSPFVLTHLAARSMAERGWGRIVMVASTAGQVGGPDMVAYVASKHGLIGLMRATAVDLAGQGVTCNAVLPGWVRTEMAELSAESESQASGLSVEEIWSRRAASYPSGRLVTEQEVAATIAFLASEEASGVNGEAVTVAGGGLW